MYLSYWREHICKSKNILGTNIIEHYSMPPQIRMKICTHPGHPYGQIFSELSEIDRISQERRYRVVFYWFTGVSDYNLQCPQTGGDDQKQKQNNKKMQLLQENTNKEGKI